MDVHRIDSKIPQTRKHAVISKFFTISSLNVIKSEKSSLPDFKTDIFTSTDKTKENISQNSTAAHKLKNNLPYVRNSSDSVNNRALKYRYSALNNFYSNLTITSDKKYKDGLYAGRGMIEDGTKYEYTHSKDRKYIFYKEADGFEFKKDGGNFYLKYPDDETQHFILNDDGGITRIIRKTGGSVLDKVIACADGGYVRINEKNEIESTQKPDSKMVEYEELIKKITLDITSNINGEIICEEYLYLLTTFLSRISLQMLKNLEKYGLKIKICTSKTALKYLDKKKCLGKSDIIKKQKIIIFHNQYLKEIFYDKELFKEGGQFFSEPGIYHEIGHALYSMIMPKTYLHPREMAILIEPLTIPEPYLENLYDQYLERINADKSKISEPHASDNVKEYFATGFHLYFSGEGKSERLKEIDPKLYEYIEKKLKEAENINNLGV